jgi:hypothetical protein
LSIWQRSLAASDLVESESFRDDVSRFLEGEVRRKGSHAEVIDVASSIVSLGGTIAYEKRVTIEIFIQMVSGVWVGNVRKTSVVSGRATYGYSNIYESKTMRGLVEVIFASEG